MSVEDWDRSGLRAADTCVSCTKPFVPGATFTAAIVIREDRFVREDRCTACAATVPADAVSHWTARRPADAKGPRRLDFDSLLELFVRMDGRTDEPSLRLRWIVGLLLMRRRLLSIVGRRVEDGREILALKPRGDEKAHEVADPGLDDDAAEALRDDLSRIFDLDRRTA